jgi:CHAP domain
MIGRGRRGLGLWALGAAAALSLTAGVVAATLMAILGADVGCLGSGGGIAAGSPPTRAAVNEIPPARLRLYQRAGQRFDVEWTVLASIGYQECAVGTCAHVYPSGCGGPMQIAIVRESACSPGAGPTIWETYGVDANGDGHADPFDLADSIFTAARLLRQVMGAPPIGGSYAAYREAACHYYGACADGLVSYADEVMARAVEYGFHGKGAPTRPGGPPPAAGGSACAASSGASANEIVRIAESQLGRAESPPGSNCTPYGPCLEWCSLFVAWVWERAGVPLKGGTAPYAYSGSIYEWAKAHEGGPFATTAPGDPPFSSPAANGARILPPTATPAPGDAVLFGSGPQASDHVGIVERVFPNGEITTIDGNYGDRVARVGPFPPAQAAARGEPAPIYGYAHPPSEDGASEGAGR